MPKKIGKKIPKKVSYDLIRNLDPFNITVEDVYNVYKLNCKPCEKKCKRNCKTNPYCLFELGEAQWLLNNEVPDEEPQYPKLIAREPGAHIGLKNLGATCYVNSLLQLWFHNKKFRETILFEWSPFEDDFEKSNPTIHNDDDNYVPQSEVGHLQALFALMTFSERSFIDPKDFVESLGLDTATQQDAQEFSKLFISLLENRLSTQSNKIVRNMISDNFLGQYSYVTRCSNCQRESVSPSTFYELELNIQGHKTLDGCLEEFLKEEKLEGADKYSCSVCNDKQDAVRFIKLKKLPHTLNLQLMRFVYDRQISDKKKLKSNLMFPEILNMDKYLGNADYQPSDPYDGDVEQYEENSSSEDNEKSDVDKLLLNRNKNLYKLTAVLAHKGYSANSGHYFAYIKDSNDKWYVFNDQLVDKNEGKKLKFNYDETKDAVKNSKNIKGYHSSTNAYMLVYTRLYSKKDKDNVCSLNKTDLLHHLQHYIQLHNSDFKKLIDEEESIRNTSLVSSYEFKRFMASSIISLRFDDTNNHPDLSTIEVLPVDWITHWLKNAKDTVDSIDNLNVICSHDKLCPDYVHCIKYVNRRGADALFQKYNGGPRVYGENIICKECIINKTKYFHLSDKLNQDSNEVFSLLKIKMNKDDIGYWVDKEYIKHWKQLAKESIEKDIDASNRFVCKSSENIIENSDKCVKDDMELPKKENSTNQSLENHKSNGLIQNQNCDVNKKILTRNAKKLTHLRNGESSKISMLSDVNNVSMEKKHNKVNSTNKSTRESSNSNNINYCGIKNAKVLLQNISDVTSSNNSDNSIFKKTGNENSNDNCRVSQDSENSDDSEGKKNSNCCTIFKDKQAKCNHNKSLQDKTNQQSNDEDGDEEFSEGVACCHGNLSIDENARRVVPFRAWEIFIKYFPLLKYFPHDAVPCQKCQNLASEGEVVKSKYKKQAADEKELLKDLFFGKNRPDIESVTTDTEFFMIPSSFLTEWRQFVRKGGRDDPPESIDTSELFCEHGNLIYCPTRDKRYPIVFVTKDEWVKLCTSYSCKNPVLINSIGDAVMSLPDVCQSCRDKRINDENKALLEYDNENIYIQKVPTIEDTPFGFFETEETVTDDSNLTNADQSVEPMKKKIKTAEVNDIHMSDPIRRSSRRKKNKDCVTLKVNSKYKLLDLKLLLMQKYSVLPSDISLVYEDGRMLLENEKKLAELEIYPNSTIYVVVNQVIEGNEFGEASLSSKRELEAGFKGTKLIS